MRLLSAPKEAYSREKVTINLPAQLDFGNETIWISLTAVDSNGGESNMSNVISTRYMPDVLAATDTSNVVDFATPGDCPPGTIIKCFSDMYLYIIIGAGAALLLLLFILLIIFCCLRKKKRRDDKKSLHNFDSPSSESPPIGHDDYYDYIGSDLADQDQIQMADEQIQTDRNQPLPSTKKRVQSINWSKSFKGMSLKRASKPPAPTPPAKPQTHSVIAKDMQRKTNKQKEKLNPVWVSSTTNKAMPTKAKTLQASSGVEQVHAERPALQPKHVDSSTMPADLAVAENLCVDFIAAEKRAEPQVSEEIVVGMDVEL